MELERRDDDQWHLVMARCGTGGTAHETIEAKPDDGFTHEDDGVRLCHPTMDDPTWCDACQAAVTDRYTQASDAIEHWKVTTTHRDIEWSDYEGAIDDCRWCRSDVDTLVHDRHTDTIVCKICATLYASSATAVDDSVTVTDHVQLADEVEPIVVIDDGSSQQLAARIDRRPYISLKPKRKYVTVLVTIADTDYQFTKAAIDRLRGVFETYEARASQQSDNKGGVEFEVNGQRLHRERRPRQQIEVSGLFEADAREFIEEVIPLVRRTTNWTYDPSEISARATQRAIRERGRPGPAPVPRDGAPEVTVQDDDLARHAPLTDKSITDSQIRSFVSDQAYRHGDALVDAGRLRVHHGGGHKGDADGYDAQSNAGFDLWFENGAITGHDCSCESTLDPCEHIAGALIALPPVAVCFV